MQRTRPSGTSRSHPPGVATALVIALLAVVSSAVTAPVALGAASASSPARSSTARSSSGEATGDAVAPFAAAHLVLDVTGSYGPTAAGAGFHPLAPVRLLDTRTGNGLDGTFLAGAPRTFRIAGRAGIPAGAVAVTVNLTVTGQTAGGYVALTPEPTATPKTSTLNFPAGDARANGATVPLAPDGTLAAVYVGAAGARTHLVLDATGWFSASGGATFHPLAPVRVLDTRTGNGLAGAFTADTPRTVRIAGRGGVPSGAVAVTVNATVTGQTARGFVALTTRPTATPSTSTLNFPLGDPRANGATVPLAPDGSLAAVYEAAAGARTHLVLDVTGYYAAAGDGATYRPLAPIRLLDTRTGNGLATTFVAATPRIVQMTGRGGIPADATAVTVNLTVTGQTTGGYLALTTRPTATPSTSTLNFPVGDTRANNAVVLLGPGGTLALVFKPSSSPPGPDYPSYDSRYHSPRELLAAVQALERRYPGLARLSSIGTSHQGREIWAAKVSDNVRRDEDEPEVLVDALHHAREHLTVEQGLYLFRTLLDDYATDAQVRRLVDTRETWFVFALNPDGWAYDLGGSPYVGWRKNRQPNSGTTAVGTDLNRNYAYRWGCCGGSSGSKSAWDYRGSAPWSATETRRLRDFVLGRVVDGEQQIRTHVSLHTNGELILWPYGYTKTDVPADMTADDHATFVAMARAMARKNSYVARQSSDLYVTDGDQIDWMYARQGIFSFTFELYPTEQVSSHADHEPPDEVIARETARNRAALLYLLEMADCPYRAIGKADTYCR